MLRLPLRRRTVTAPGISLLLLLLLFLLRRRTIHSRPSSSLFPPSSQPPFPDPSFPFPLSPQLSRFPDTILLPPPSFPRSSQPHAPLPWSLPPPPLHHSARPPSTPAATFTILRLLRPQHPPPFSYSGPDSPSPLSCSGPDSPHLHFPTPAPTAPISLLYTPLRSLYTSSTPLSYS
ncbi:unnamed protein product, partial [Musa acuminata subsp. burmannicoides]